MIDIGKRAYAATAAVLGIASAAVVFGQARRTAVLFDLTYILDNAHRIRLGEVPYRDFPLAHAPGTFLLQALIESIPRSTYQYHLIYCMMVAAITALATTGIIRQLFQSAGHPQPRTAGIVLASPVIVLTGYSQLPNPFYDPDACLAVLICLFLLQRTKTMRAAPFLAGATAVLPYFIKQNIGLFFAAGMALALALTAYRNPRERPAIALTAASAAATLATIAIALHVFVGLDKYIYWTIEYAASRRAPGVKALFVAYAHPAGFLSLGLVAGAGALYLRAPVSRNRVFGSAVLLGAVLLSVGLSRAIGAESNLFPDWRALWLVALGMGAVVSANDFGSAKPPTTETAVAPVVLTTVFGTFLSLGFNSSYGVWPLLCVLLAAVVTGVIRSSNAFPSRHVNVLTIALSVTTLTTGALRTGHRDFLFFVDLTGAPATAAIHPRLRGLRSDGGQQIAAFDALLSWVAANIPLEQRVLVLPGEDPFYYATGRRPPLPIAQFESTTLTPYSDAQLAELIARSQVHWFILKTQLQKRHWPMDVTRVRAMVPSTARLVARVENYEIFKQEVSGSP